MKRLDLVSKKDVLMGLGCRDQVWVLNANGVKTEVEDGKVAEKAYSPTHV